MEDVTNAAGSAGKNNSNAPSGQGSFPEKIKINIDRSFMSAYVEFTRPAGGALLSADDIYRSLKNANIAYGIDDAKVMWLADNPAKPYDEQISIANGAPPVDGKDAELQIHFKVVRDKTPKILEDGSVDHKHLDIVEGVSAGALLATLIPEQEGSPGTNLRGQVLKCKKGKPRQIPKGRNTELSEDKLRLYATVDGSVEIKNGQIQVIDVMDIQGDVGPATGSVDFAGDVTISGSIVSTYNVKASGSINVGGVIEASIIEAGGDIVIRQGIKGLSASGKMSCIVKAGGNVTAKFIENAIVHASGTVRSDAILHSEVYAGDSVVASGKKGKITGGRIRALHEISCIDVGSRHNSNNTTTFEVGVQPGVREGSQRVKKEMDVLEKELSECNILIKELAATQPLSQNQLLRLKTLSDTKKDLEIRLEPLRAEYEKFQAQMVNARQGRVHVKSYMNPTVSMTIGGLTEHYTTEYSNATFAYRDGEGIVLLPYSL